MQQNVFIKVTLYTLLKIKYEPGLYTRLYEGQVMQLARQARRAKCLSAVLQGLLCGVKRSRVIKDLLRSSLFVDSSD